MPSLAATTPLMTFGTVRLFHKQLSRSGEGQTVVATVGKELNSTYSGMNIPTGVSASLSLLLLSALAARITFLITILVVPLSIGSPQIVTSLSFYLSCIPPLSFGIYALVPTQIFMFSSLTLQQCMFPESFDVFRPVFDGFKRISEFSIVIYKNK